MLSVALTLTFASFAVAGSPWAGNMHPDIGFNTGCNATTLRDCAPSYANLRNAGALWPCPAGNNGTTTPTCAAASGCTQGSGENPLCPALSKDAPCCCAKRGCAVTPEFNQIIGVCRGDGCACGDSKAPSCGGGHCDNACSGPIVPCCFGNDVTDLQPFYSHGSDAKINYLAAFQFDSSSNVWRIQEESSFNTNGSRPTFDMMKDHGGLNKEDAWLSPQPGGSVFWSLGYYPAGKNVRGVGPPGMMFVMSTEAFYGATWYSLNRVTLERGPATGYPAEECPGGLNDNCWASGNAGEFDFLEPAWNTGNATATEGYRRAYATQTNQVGRCFNGGVNPGGFGSRNYLLTASPDAPEAIVYVALFDSVGVWVYRIPASQVDSVWPGMSRTSINATVQAAPSQRPSSVNPCTGGFCALFTSNCQAHSWSDADAQQCIFNRQQGFCGNWMAQLADTKQPLFPSDDCERDVRGGVQMPWCKDML